MLRSYDRERMAVSAEEIMRWARDLVDPALRSAVGRLPDAVAEVVGYHFGWAAGRGGGGKAMRPALTFLSAEAVGGDAAVAMDAAVAVELVHNFSLLHDDVMDNDRLRRHRPTTWVVYGVPAAILAGDALLALAMRILAERDGRSARWLTGALMSLVDGQCADLTMANRADVGREECVAMAAGKTGALMGIACALGARAAGAGQERAASLRQFGEHLGLAFQLVDDLLGIWGDPGVTGKPAGPDLVTRKKSLPVVAALNSGHAAARELAERYADPRPFDETDVLAVAGLVERAGGRDWARSESRRQLASARSCLAAARPRPAAAERLECVARLIADRDR
jgi:geranylgeranyl diphosphate synthase, type I